LFYSKFAIHWCLTKSIFTWKCRTEQEANDNAVE